MTTYFCPQCASPGFALYENKKLYCSNCHFTYFHNVASAVAVIIIVDRHLLLIRRAGDPGKGMLGLPGGFVDPGEDAEQALRRELAEEVGIDYQGQLNYLGSWANDYRYKGIDYKTQDVYYQINLNEKPKLSLAEDEVSEVLWLALDDIDLSQLAFVSAKQALQRLLTNS